MRRKNQSMPSSAENSTERVYWPHPDSTPENLPDATANPCEDCPWRREAMRGWLGPSNADSWLDAAHSDVAIPCHKRSAYVNGTVDWEDPETRQCRGIAIFRANVCKSPRDHRVVSGPADTEKVFANDGEFREHHEGSPFDVWREKQRT